MNGCKNRELALLKYEEGLLEGMARAEVETHLAECRTCKQWLEEYGQLKQMVQSEEMPERGGEYWAAFQRSILARVHERGLLHRADAGRGRGITADQGRFFKRYGAAAASVLVVFVLVVGLARIGLLTSKGQPGKAPVVMTDGEIELSLIMGTENGTDMSQDRERLLEEFFHSKMEETLLERLQAIDEQTDFFSTLQQLPTNGTKAEEEFYRELFDIPAIQNGWQKT